MSGYSARVLSVLVLLLAGRTSAQAQRFPAFDPERIFILGDADLDGRLSLDEYRDFHHKLDPIPRRDYYAGRDMRLTDVKGVVHKGILA